MEHNEQTDKTLQKVNILQHRRGISKLLLFSLILSLISIGNLQSDNHIEAHAAGCPKGGSPITIANLGCSSCGGSGITYINSDAGTERSKKDGSGLNSRTEVWQGMTWEVYYRCFNCGEVPQYSAEVYKIVIDSNGRPGYSEGYRMEGNSSRGDGYVPMRWCNECGPILKGQNKPYVDREATYNVYHVQAEKYTITVNANPANAGTTLGSGSYENGTILNIVATANSGWTFSGWADDASASSARQVFVTGDKTYTANFVTSTPTPTPKPDDVYIETRVGKGKGTTSGDGYYPKSSTATARINAIPADGYEFAGWKIYKTADNSLLDERISASTTVTTNYDKYAVADFKEKDDDVIVTTSAEPSKGGTTTGGGTYKKGSSVTINATANKDYEFVRWIINVFLPLFKYLSFPFL